jgi:hypothetical protein
MVSTRLYLRVAVIADVRRWGNSLAVRIPADEAEALGIREGDRIKFTAQKVPSTGKVDVSHAPFFRTTDERPPRRGKLHEEAADAMWDHLVEKKRRSRAA